MGKAQSKNESPSQAASTLPVADPEVECDEDGLPLPDAHAQTFSDSARSSFDANGQQQPWLQPNAPRDAIHEFLLLQSQGDFVIYKDPKTQTTHLAVQNGTGVDHFAIIENEEQKFQAAVDHSYAVQPTFESLEALVKFYQRRDLNMAIHPFRLRQTPSVFQLDETVHSTEEPLLPKDSESSAPATPVPTPVADNGGPDEPDLVEATSPQPDPVLPRAPATPVPTPVADSDEPGETDLVEVTTTTADSLYGTAVGEPLSMDLSDIGPTDMAYGDVRRPVDATIEEESDDEENVVDFGFGNEAAGDLTAGSSEARRLITLGCEDDDDEESLLYFDLPMLSAAMAAGTEGGEGEGIKTESAYDLDMGSGLDAPVNPLPETFESKVEPDAPDATRPQAYENDFSPLLATVNDALVQAAEVELAESKPVNASHPDSPSTGKLDSTQAASAAAGLPDAPPRPSLNQSQDNLDAGKGDMDLDAINEDATDGDEHDPAMNDVDYLKPAVLGERAENGDAGQSNDYSKAYERLPDDDTEDIYRWARGIDPHLSAGAIQPLWVHGTYLNRDKAEQLLVRFGRGQGLFLVRERQLRDANDACRFCLSLVIDHGIEHHLIADNGTMYSMPGSKQFRTVRQASDLSSILMQINAAVPGALRQAIVIPKLSREEIGGFPDFFHGKIDRHEANRRLRIDGGNAEGHYLVRVSSNVHGSANSGAAAAFVISVVSNKLPMHHVVRRDGNHWVLNDAFKFPHNCINLTDVLSFLMHPLAHVSFQLRSYVRCPPVYRPKPFGAPVSEFDGLPPPLIMSPPPPQVPSMANRPKRMYYALCQFDPVAGVASLTKHQICRCFLS
ncbi:uncharacterized protein MONBRDRAFT_26003 [Monosiga brevicollis MX1]|uniref:SH2 domain-containing protein n=1 Tax=Monosiga brevicollis TaxID=81824 RepID=A9V133_MONBE|nr:uncharacterized protein MONBRDRAFT_26003 [Monosiga brevicollis MX1]EDQ88862.1 predicted protein [Monosiga brevicollis MX1]|eukprot:XP_001746475.1 hypothetical protein [Monosiga brevicollis MX1]